MRYLTLASLALVCALISITEVGADPVCNPRDFLERNHVSLDENLETNLVVLDELLESKAKQSKSSLSGSYAGYSLTGDDARKATSTLKKALNLRFTEQQKRTLLISALDPEGVKAYGKCLENNKAHLSVTVSEGAITKREVLVSVKWHPFYRAPDAAPVGALVTGGAITEVLYDNILYKSLGEVKPKPQSTITLKLTRSSIFTDSEIAGSIDGHEYRVDIPGAPRTRLVHELKEGSLIDFGPARETCSKPTLTSCVRLSSSDEGVLLPGTFKWVDPIEEVLSLRTIAEPKTTEDVTSICHSFTLGCPKLFKNYARIKKRGAALLVKAVAIPE